MNIKIKNIPTSNKQLFEIYKQIEQDSQSKNLEINMFSIILYFLLNFEELKDVNDENIQYIPNRLSELQFKDLNLGSDLEDILGDFELFWSFRFNDINPVSFNEMKNIVFSYMYEHENLRDYFFNN